MIRIALLLLIPAVASAKVSFNRDIRPILSKNCLGCHGPDEKDRKGDFHLDTFEGITKGGKSGPGITVGNPEASEVIKRVTTSDPDDVMPPADHGKPLKSEEIELLRQWIKEGADYEPHWSLQKPQPVTPPATDHPSPRNPIDHFIAERLKSENLAFSPEADRRTLIRRLSFDLTGLPPSPREIAAFLADTSPQAYESLVDRLLASPRFGEHFAASWLDASRYADTNGYSIDGGRHQWIWRDWVIKSFNDNQPYDQFLTEQLAGDLLPGSTEQQIVATGFNRNHAITHEGGTIPEENLVNYVADRVKTTSETFLGLTLACAQCHDHKYDPFSQRDYYRFYAFFNTLDDAGLDGNAGNNAKPSFNAASCLANPAETKTIRFRTIGDITCTGAVESTAADLDPVIQEVATARQTERGTRADDKRSETAMEDRKKEGYF